MLSKREEFEKEIKQRQREKQAFQNLKNKVKTKEALRALEIANIVSDLIIFHSNIFEMGEFMDTPFDK